MMQSACIAVAEAAKWLYNVLTDFIEGLSKAITKVGGELYRSQKAIDNQ
jgi:hypothetical protein